MKLSYLAEHICTDGHTIPEIEITGLTADSRQVSPGFLFAALAGEQVDGARFIPSAMEKGAAAILCAPESLPEGLGDIPMLTHENPRLALALMARRFYPAQPDQLVAITGTNGKSSIASFVRQIWDHLGLAAASLGTIGIETAAGIEPLDHTTPDPVTVSALLQRLSEEGIQHVAFEASSHGLSQFRLHGLKLTAGAFSNITRDHMDYHASFDDYFRQKMRLFEEVMQPRTPAVIWADHGISDEVIRRAKACDLDVMSIGEKGAHMRLTKCEQHKLMQHLCVTYDDEVYDISLPLAGRFQVENALIAAGLVIACGAEAASVFPMLSRLTGARGRLEKVGQTEKGATIFIDYAHTPDALENAIKALRPAITGKLVVVFGCGGDRDKGKRPLMGSVAKQSADHVIVTDDNPRSENPDEIRAQILAACDGADNIGARDQAIKHAIMLLEEGDGLLIAGKGHETGQIIGDKHIPFSDHDVVRQHLKGV